MNLSFSFTNYSFIFFAVDDSIVVFFCFLVGWVLVWFLFQNQRWNMLEQSKEKWLKRLFFLVRKGGPLLEFKIKCSFQNSKKEPFPKQNCCPSCCHLGHPEVSLSSFALSQPGFREQMFLGSSFSYTHHYSPVLLLKPWSSCTAEWIILFTKQ